MATQRIKFDGTASSVSKIMDIVGTSGVNNSEGEFVSLPYGEIAHFGDTIVSEDGFWWIETAKHKVEEE